MKVALLCFGIASIASVSGMEKVFAAMANEFTRRGHTVYAVWNDHPGVKPFYPLVPQVQGVNLGLGKIKAPFSFKVLRELNKGLHLNAVNKVDQYKTGVLAQAVQKRLPADIDIYICYEFNSVMVANKLAGGRIPVVAMVHNSVADQLEALTPRQRQEASKATVYQVLMPSYVGQAEKLLTTKVVYIPNTVPQFTEAQLAQPGQTKQRHTVIHVGRVEGRQKRQLILIQAFAELASNFPEWDVEYYGPIGDADYKKQIDALIKKHNLQERVKYKGVTKDVDKALQQADIFAFPSAYEGFPLALTEAMAIGLPVICVRDAPGVAELIQAGQDGYLAQTARDFTQKLDRLMEHADLRTSMGAKAREAMQRFAPAVVWQQWEDLLQSLIKKG